MFYLGFSFVLNRFHTYKQKENKIQADEIEMLKNLVQAGEKFPVRVAKFLLNEVDKITNDRQAFVNIAIIEKIAREKEGG